MQNHLFSQHEKYQPQIQRAKHSFLFISTRTDTHTFGNKNHEPEYNLIYFPETINDTQTISLISIFSFFLSILDLLLFSLSGSGFIYKDLSFFPRFHCVILF